MGHSLRWFSMILTWFFIEGHIWCPIFSSYKDHLTLQSKQEGKYKKVPVDPCHFDVSMNNVKLLFLWFRFLCLFCYCCCSASIHGHQRKANREKPYCYQMQIWTGCENWRRRVILSPSCVRHLSKSICDF